MDATVSINGRPQMQSNNQVGWKLNPWRKEAGGFSRAFVYELINEGKIETAKVGGRRIIITPPRDFLSRHLEKRGQ